MSILILLAYTSSHAGTLTNGTWTPSSCGERPVVPNMIGDSIDKFNKSLKAANSWQERANTYNVCMVEEANADNGVISKTANELQEKFQAEVDKINKEAAKLKAGLDDK